jgi:hypothetical protein
MDVLYFVVVLLLLLLLSGVFFDFQGGLQLLTVILK